MNLLRIPVILIGMTISIINIWQIIHILANIRDALHDVHYKLKYSQNPLCFPIRKCEDMGTHGRNYIIDAYNPYPLYYPKCGTNEWTDIYEECNKQMNEAMAIIIIYVFESIGNMTLIYYICKGIDVSSVICYVFMVVGMIHIVYGMDCQIHFILHNIYINITYMVLYCCVYGIPKFMKLI